MSARTCRSSEATMRLTTPREIGAYIRDRRRAERLSQQELADLSGVSTRWLVDVENGKTGAQIGMVLRVLRTLGVVLDATQTVPTQPTAPDSANPAVAGALRRFDRSRSADEDQPRRAAHSPESSA